MCVSVHVCVCVCVCAFVCARLAGSKAKKIYEFARSEVQQCAVGDSSDSGRSFGHSAISHWSSSSTVRMSTETLAKFSDFETVRLPSRPTGAV